jgi:hypothetical protein
MYPYPPPPLVVNNLLFMSESAGMAHLAILVPQLARDGMLGYVIELLFFVAYEDPNAPEDIRHKAVTFALHAQVLQRYSKPRVIEMAQCH